MVAQDKQDAQVLEVWIIIGKIKKSLEFYKFKGFFYFTNSFIYFNEFATLSKSPIFSSLLFLEIDI